MELGSLLCIALVALAAGMLIAVAIALLTWDSPGGPGWHRKQYEAALEIARRATEATHLGSALDEAALQTHRKMLRAAMKQQKRSQ